MWKCHWKRLKWDWIKVLRELSLRQSILPDPNIMNPILLINVTYRCWSGPQQRKKTNTNTVDIRTPRRHNVKKNCVAIINPEKKNIITAYSENLGAMTSMMMSFKPVSAAATLFLLRFVGALWDDLHYPILALNVRAQRLHFTTRCLLNILLLCKFYISVEVYS